ncbi:MAG: Unknown protein [uncultured Sulfurovum sp.]|uniref:Type I restriction modification DNA specificity domain-containing protein n=1 Tax=uncultured Sulfurovum sp. TaxID=269237 RepID=A0A6S6S8K5_9BACT|nr:MAG: Unknown protein [uncultured Sulfurovum sp.]
MKLQEIAEVIKGIHLIEGGKKEKVKEYKELTMLSLEPISFLDERKFISVDVTHQVSQKQLTKAGDIIVSLYSPMIACYVEKGQEGYVVPHYMSIIRVKSYIKMDSRFIVHFINSSRGRRALAKMSENCSYSKPTSLPLVMLNEVELLAGTNNIMERL